MAMDAWAEGTHTLIDTGLVRTLCASLSRAPFLTMGMDTPVSQGESQVATQWLCSAAVLFM